MIDRVHRTPYGRPAAELLHARVSALKREDALAQVTLVVPTNFVGVSMRRVLASGALGSVGAGCGGLAGLGMLTVYRLADLLGAARLAAEGRRPVSTPLVAAAVRAELTRDAGVFAEVRDHPATEEALVRAHRELSELDADALDRLASAGPRAGDVVDLHQRVRERLRGDWYDESDLMAAATAATREPAPLIGDLGAVILHLPQRLSRRAATMLRAVAEHVPVEAIVGETGDVAADHDVRIGLERLLGPRVAMGAAGDAGSGAEVVPPATDVLVTSDPDEEVRACVRAIVDAAREGIPFERIAVLYPSRDPYARLLSEQLVAAGIPHNGRAARPLADRSAGRWLLDALSLPERGFSRAAVLDVLACTPGADGVGSRYPIASYARASREAGVVGGRDWEERLRGFAERSRQEAADELAAEDAREWLARRLEGDATAADSLAGVVARLRRQFSEAHRAASWSELVEWARGLLLDACGDEAARERWPAQERAAAERLEAALDRLTLLDGVDARPSPTVFRRTLELELDADLGRDGRFGEGVLVGEVSAGLGVDLDLVMVCGLAEGVLPAPLHEDSLLPDAERSRVGDDLPTRTGRVHAERRQLVAALAGARRRLLLYPRGDLRRSVERPPSRWLLESVAGLPGDRPERADGTPDTGVLPRAASWLHRIPSFDAGIRTAMPATAQEYRLRALAEHRTGGAAIDEHPLAKDDPALARALELYRARTSERLTRFDGDLSGLPDLPGLVGSPADGIRELSPTRLEAYARCPHAYLLEHVLGVQEIEEPEEQLTISPREFGSLVHEILDRWLAVVLEDPPAPGAPYSEAHRRLLFETMQTCCREYAERGVTGHPRLWELEQERLARDLELFCEHDDRHRGDQGLQPIGSEVTFGVEGAAVVVRLPEGREIRFRGRLDRLDGQPGGGVVVTDYKTGSGRSAEYGWLRQDPVARGRLLQLPVYGLAARQLTGDPAWVRAQYWFCTARGDFKLRAVDLDEGAETRFLEVLGTLVSGIEQGLFPAVAPPPDGRPFVECAHCDPDGLGTAERRRIWERKRSDPRISALVAVVEPEEAG